MGRSYLESGGCAESLGGDALELRSEVESALETVLWVLAQSFLHGQVE